MNILWFKDCSYENKQLVGGKNASLGELYHLSKSLNFNIANGFAITTELYDAFIQENQLNEIIEETIQGTQVEDIEDLNQKSTYIKELFINATLSNEHIQEIL